MDEISASTNRVAWTQTIYQGCRNGLDAYKYDQRDIVRAPNIAKLPATKYEKKPNLYPVCL